MHLKRLEQVIVIPQQPSLAYFGPSIVLHPEAQLGNLLLCKKKDKISTGFLGTVQIYGPVCWGQECPWRDAQGNGTPLRSVGFVGRGILWLMVQ